MPAIITILCVILCILMLIMFVTGQPWDTRTQSKIDKVNKWIEVTTAALCGLIVICFIFLLN